MVVFENVGLRYGMGAEILKDINLYGELHRFIPALASAVGARICEVPIQNIVRPKGKSNYGITRTFRVMMDLLTVRFLIKYFTRPLHFLGGPALISFAIGVLIEANVAFEKFRAALRADNFFEGWDQYHVTVRRGPLMVIGVLLIVLAVITMTTGLLGELIVRTYYESQGKHIYYIRKIYRKDGAA